LPESAARADPGTWLVVNADDLGLSRGINRGIVHAHLHGMVTSASLVVIGPRAREAVTMTADCPDLSLGLHFTATAEDGEPLHDLHDPVLLRSEVDRQVDAFAKFVGAMPTHLDSHHHVHRRRALREMFVEAAAELGVPLRRAGTVTYHGFYAQWEHGVTDLDHISVEYLVALLRGLGPGVHEIGSHPGFVSDDFVSIYHREREAEIATLTDPRVREAANARGIQLVGYRQLTRAMVAEGRTR
jgi:predicted glycoside hydrolase/deacetylase ChbG (UPF0249 family)